jgi:exopolysaccharide biosynthesis polyprenyl glycosylphosphotransferase
MVQKMRVKLIGALKTFDIICVIASLCLVSFLSHGSINAEQLFGMTFDLFDIITFFIYVIAYHFVLCWHRLYTSRRLTGVNEEVIDIVMATLVGSLLLLLLLNIHGKTPANSEIIIFWANCSAFLISSRLLLRATLRRCRLKGKNLRHIVIAGINERAVLFAQELLSRPELGYRLIGFVDDVGERTPEFDKTGYELVADVENFAEFLRKQVVDEVMICLPVKSHYQQAANIAAICEEHGIIVRFLSDIFNPKFAHSTVHQFEGRPVTTLYTGHMVGRSMIVKRMMDIIISLALIAALAPVFLIAAVLVKFSSKGPVFFVQKRLGLNKRHFDICKFRTMCCDAEQRQAELEHLNEASGAAFKIKEDPRITPVGSLLRKTSIDELPQLLNVLKGEMSLVGPRPLPIRDYEGFDKDWHRRRFSVRPGITCLWQISGRSNISFDRWMELDMEYIDRWSLWLDIKILLQTIPAVIRGAGAV